MHSMHFISGAECISECISGVHTLLPNEGISRDLVRCQPFRARWQRPKRRGSVSARIHQEKYQNIVAAAAAMALAAVAAAVLQRSQRPEQLLLGARSACGDLGWQRVRLPGVPSQYARIGWAAMVHWLSLSS